MKVIFVKNASILLVFALNFITEINGAKILAIQIIHSGSYGNLLTAIVNTLASEHEITLYSNMHKKSTHPNVTVKYIKPIMINLEFNHNSYKTWLNNEDVSLIFHRTAMSLTEDYVKQVLSDPIFQELFEKKEKFDLFLTYSSLSEYMYQFAHFFNVPLVQISATVPNYWQKDHVGIPNILSSDNCIITDEYPKSFMNRLIRYVKNVRYIINFSWFYLPRLNKVTKSFFPPGTPPIEEVAKNTSLLLINTHDAMGYSQPLVPNCVKIGGIHIKPTKPLEKDVEDFISNSGEHGIIYFSFGTAIGSHIPDYYRNLYAKVMGKIPQRVLWKQENTSQDLAKNILVSRWFSQQDILTHNKTRLFIMQGGILSFQESMYHGVPILVIPHAYDQPLNSRIIQNLGVGRRLTIPDITEERLFSEISEIINNPTYAKRAKEVSELMKNYPYDPKEQLSTWINYIIKHKGYPLYQPEKNVYSWMNIIDVDIMLFFIFLFFCILCFAVFICVFAKRIFTHTIISKKLKAA